VKFKPSATFLDPVMNFLNARSLRQKMTILIAAGVAVVALDYFLILNPMIRVFVKITPKISVEGAELRQLKEDKRNAAKTEEQWKSLKMELSTAENRFVDADGMPTLLENLSKLASASGIRIMSLKPEAQTKASIQGFNRVPIKISAQGGTHELGRFLAQLEGGKAFFRVRDLKIQTTDIEPRRHRIELDIETYQKVG
jgi:Tfp pilus assembly protein PilO